jgi:hypothetical protein
MGTPKNPRPVQFFASIIFADEVILSEALARLTALIGNVLERTEVLPFSHTHYYEKEMGPDLSRLFVLFEPLLEREMLAEVKLKTNEIEQALAEGNRRNVNIDAGYITLENVILATTKGYTHRIYLEKGIFADLTLIFGKGSFKTLEWTYPDYGEAASITLFNRWRDQYKRTLRCQRA